MSVRVLELESQTGNELPRRCWELTIDPDSSGTAASALNC